MNSSNFDNTNVGKLHLKISVPAIVGYFFKSMLSATALFQVTEEKQEVRYGI